MSTAHIASRRSRILHLVRRQWPWVIILLPLGVYLFFVPGFGAAQNNDYFGSITSLLGAEASLSERVEQFVFARSNEHRIAVPMLVYAANLALAAGSNRPLSAFAVAMMLVVFVLLYRCLPPPATATAARRIFFGLVLACFAFTPVAAHNIAMGFSGTMWFLANAAFVGGLAVLVKRGRDAGVLGLVPVALLGVVGLFSYSTSLAMWPALVIGALCLGLSWRQHAALLVMALASYGYYFTTYATPGHLPSPNTGNPRAAIEFFGIYLGGIYTTDLVTARWIGWCGAVAFVMLVVVVVARRRDHLAVLAPWLSIMTFGLVNAVGTSIGRSNFSAQMGVASRYATLPGLFWAGLLVAMGCLWVVRDGDRSLATAARSSHRRTTLPAVAPVLAMVAVSVVAGGLIAAMYGRGLPLLEAFVDRAHNQRLAVLALIRGHNDIDALRMLTPAPAEAWRSRDVFIRLGHYPFDRPPAQPPATLAPLGSALPTGLLGGVLSRARTAEGTIRPTGWASTAPGTPRITDWAVADAEGHTVGALIGELPTPRGGASMTDQRFAGWGGYAIGIDPQALRVFVRLEADPAWYPLP